MMEMNRKERRLIKKCPVCGGRLFYSCFMQYTDHYVIRAKDGRIARSVTKKSYSVSLEQSFVTCERGDFVTDTFYDVEIPREMSKQWAVEIEDDKVYLVKKE